MNTPNVWSLNLRGEAFLAAEEKIWLAKYNAASGRDRLDVGEYLTAVQAELSQRRAQYAEGTTGAIKAGLSAIFEAVGSSAGAGASGLAGEVTDSAGNVISGAGSFLQKNILYIIGALVLVGVAWVYFNRK